MLVPNIRSTFAFICFSPACDWKIPSADAENYIRMHNANACMCARSFCNGQRFFPMPCFFFLRLFVFVVVRLFVRSFSSFCVSAVNAHIRRRKNRNRQHKQHKYVVCYRATTLCATRYMYYIVHCLVTMMKKEKWKQIAKFILHTTENVRTHRTPANFIHFLCAVQRELQLQRWIGNIRRIA